MGSETESNDPLISKAFLENALREEGKYKDFEILSFKVSMGSKPGDNYMSIIYTIDVDLKVEGVPLKRSLLIKCYPNHPGRQQFANKSNFFFKEMEVYSKWIPELERMQREVVGLGEGERVKLPYAPFVHGECIDFDSREGN